MNIVTIVKSVRPHYLPWIYFGSCAIDFEQSFLMWQHTKNSIHDYASQLTSEVQVPLLLLATILLFGLIVGVLESGFV